MIRLCFAFLSLCCQRMSDPSFTELVSSVHHPPTHHSSASHGPLTCAQRRARPQGQRHGGPCLLHSFGSGTGSENREVDGCEARGLHERESPPSRTGQRSRTGRSAPAQESGTTAPPTVPASASACRGRPASDRVSGGGGDGERTPQGGGGRERRGDGSQKTKTIAGCHNGEGGSERRWWGASRCRPGPTRSRSCRNGGVFHPPTAVGPALPRARCSRCPGMWAKEGGGTGCVKARERAYSRVRRLL